MGRRIVFHRARGTRGARGLRGYCAFADSAKTTAITIDSIASTTNRRIIIPNNSVFGEVIENVTHHPVRRVQVEVGTAYAADIDTTRKALERAIETVPEFVRDPEPSVVLTGLGASSVDWSVRAWARNDDFLGAKQALLRAVKIELDSTGVDIPFPQMDVTVTSSG